LPVGALRALQGGLQLLKRVDQHKTGAIFLIGTQHLDLNNEQVKTRSKEEAVI